MKGLQEISALKPEQGFGSGHRELLLRIAVSQTLQRSPRLRDLLLDIGELSLAGNSGELSEHAIGVRVFRRPEAYNSSEDTIVRSSVRQLRLKLKEYFETEGVAESFTLEIPKGGYLATFHPRPAVVFAPPAPVPLSERSKPRLNVVLGVLCLLLLACCIYLLARNKNGAGVAPAPARTAMSAFFDQTTGPVHFVLTDSALVIMNLMSPAPAALETYADQSYVAKDLAALETPAERALLNNLKSRQITSLADVLILTKTMQAVPSAARRIEVRHAKHIAARDFKSGNFIVTGSPRSNPWSALFEPALNFRFDFGVGAIRNTAAAKGEPALFQPHMEDRFDYARVALLRNFSEDGFVLLIAGTNMEGTEGAGDFLLRDDSLPAIRRTLGLRENDRLPPFELVLQIATMEGTARAAKIVAWRRH